MMEKPLRRTKIVATLGPASSDRATLRRLIQAGVDVVRLNFSHGNAKDHVQTAGLVRDIAGECDGTNSMRICKVEETIR